MKTRKILVIVVLALCLVVSGSRTIEASFLDDFENPGLVDYTDSNSYGSGGSFTISGGKLNITTGADNTFSVMTSETVRFGVGETLSLEVPGVSGNRHVFMMCSTTAGQPDGITTFGFRFRRDGGYARMHLYPGDIVADTLDPDPTKPATVCVKRTSDTDFDYSIIIDGARTQLGSFTLSELAGIINLHIGAQAYSTSSNTFAFDNLQVYNCEDYFIDGFGDYDPNAYTFEDSYGSGGSFTISGGKLNITTGADNTASVMTTDCMAFCVGETLSLEVPAVSGNRDVFMMCSTTAGQPDGTTTFGFRFRRDDGYARMDLYPGGILANTLDPDPTKPATVCVKRTSDTDFDYSIIIDGARTQLGSFTLSELAGIINLHIGAQAYSTSSNTFAFDNLQIARCGDWGYHPMDFNLDCYVNMLDFAAFAAGWLECTMPGEPGCVGNVEKVPFSVVIFPDT